MAASICRFYQQNANKKEVGNNLEHLSSQIYHSFISILAYPYGLPNFRWEKPNYNMVLFGNKVKFMNDDDECQNKQKTIVISIHTDILLKLTIE